jgi:hypothetical protein
VGGAPRRLVVCLDQLVRLWKWESGKCFPLGRGEWSRQPPCRTSTGPPQQSGTSFLDTPPTARGGLRQPNWRLSGEGSKCEERLNGGDCTRVEYHRPWLLISVARLRVQVGALAHPLRCFLIGP